MHDRSRRAAEDSSAGRRDRQAARLACAGPARRMHHNGSRPSRRGHLPGGVAGDRAGPRAVRGEGEVVAVSQGRYTVVYERDESGAWNAHVPEVPGCHTYGRSIRQAARRIREALELWVDDAAQAELVPEIRLPRQAQAAVRRAKAARARVAREQREAATAAHEAVECLSAHGPEHPGRQRRPGDQPPTGTTASVPLSSRPGACGWHGLPRHPPRPRLPCTPPLAEVAAAAPSVPADVIATVMVLQALEGLSDRDACRQLAKWSVL